MLVSLSRRLGTRNNIRRKLFNEPYSIFPSRMLMHILSKIQDHGNRTAVVSKEHVATFRDLLRESHALSVHLCSTPSLRTTSREESDISEHRLAFMAGRDHTYPISQFAIWQAGGIAVPLHPDHPAAEIEYVLTDADVTKVLIHPQHKSLMEPIAKKLGIAVHILDTDISRTSLECDDDYANDIVSNNAHLDKHRRAQILYTSGTTGKPKGVVTTHGNLLCQVKDIVEAWEMTPHDRVLNFLPLHHTHGIVNNLLAVLYAGATCEFVQNAAPCTIFNALAAASGRTTMLMAVPTIYMNLIESLDEMSAAERKRFIPRLESMRLCISGSMACPVSVIERWRELTGHILVERYGMTELGMVLTNPLHSERHMGFVGLPFPRVKVRVVDPDTENQTAVGEGELRVCGPTVFKEYWRRQKETAECFDKHGWFKTGDIVQFDPHKNSYRIRGRASVDIIKTGGYKVSALDVESVLNTHPDVRESYVFGVPNDKWGEIVSAIVRVGTERTTRSSVRNGDDTTLQSIESFAKERLADYKRPREIKIVQQVPKNAMGKVNKKQLRKMFFL